MSLTVKKGSASLVRQSTNLSGSNGNVRSTQSYSFRLDNTAAVMQTSTDIGLSDGDNVTAVGEVKNGTFEVYTLRNDTSGATTKMPCTFTFILGLCLTILGAMTLVFLIGLVVLPFGIYLLVKSRKMKKANELLQLS